MKDGIPCTVFRRELEAACPELAEFLSKAGNQTHDVHAKETRVQLMLYMHQLFIGQKKWQSPPRRLDQPQQLDQPQRK